MSQEAASKVNKIIRKEIDYENQKIILIAPFTSCGWRISILKCLPTSICAWINRLEETIKNVTMNMDKYDFNAASNHLYNFVYDDFCSQYLEMSKVALNSDDETKKNITKQVLITCLKNVILLIYPYTPFIAEELYCSLPNHLESVMLESYPKYDKGLVDITNDYQVELLFNLIKDVRNYKIENKLAPNANLELSLLLKKDMFADFMSYLKRFSFSEVKLISDNKTAKGESHIYNEAELYIVNEAGKDELLAKLDKEIESLKNEIKRCEGMLNNPNFISKAPADKVSLEREKLQKHLDNLKVLENKKQNL